MNTRIERLHNESVNVLPSVSSERAELMTSFYRSLDPREHSVPVLRALALRHLLEQQSIHIGEDELIVGERGPRPKATPTYPELCCHTLEDLRILPTRGKTPFQVDESTRALYADTVIPFWDGRSMRDRVFAAMSPEWTAAFEAGVFTLLVAALYWRHANRWGAFAALVLGARLIYTVKERILAGLSRKLNNSSYSKRRTKWQ